MPWVYHTMLLSQMPPTFLSTHTRTQVDPYSEGMLLSEAEVCGHTCVCLYC